MVLDDNQSNPSTMGTINILLEIGVLLTGIGLFFTCLGVLLFFDRGLLAIGNVLYNLIILLTYQDFISFWNITSDRCTKNGPIFLSETKTSRNSLFFGWHLLGAYWLGFHWPLRRNIWIH
jgi:hypothetical protein